MEGGEGLNTPVANDQRIGRGFLAKAWERTGAVRAGIIAGALCGAVFGGVAGRILMRVIFLIDRSTDGAKTDFGTVGEITVGGTFTLLVLSTIGGAVGGVIYVAVRRWLPFSAVGRGVSFGLIMMFGPGIIALGEVDLQIFEPALPIFAMFVALIVLYGVGVTLLADRLHAPPLVQPGRRSELATRVLQCVVAVGICVVAVLVTYNVQDKAGSCLSVDQHVGGCALRPGEEQAR
jgi:hypothetical protein